MAKIQTNIHTFLGRLFPFRIYKHKKIYSFRELLATKSFIPNLIKFLPNTSNNGVLETSEFLKVESIVDVPYENRTKKDQNRKETM